MITRKPVVALLTPWIPYLAFVVITVVAENSPLRGNSQIRWMTRGHTPIYFFSAMAVIYLACRIWLGSLLRWPLFQRITGIIGLGVVEAGVVFVVFLFWAVGMIGGPINPG